MYVLARVLGNECAQPSNGRTGESDDSDGRKQMAEQVARVNVEAKSEDL